MPDWRAQARCLGADPALFFDPERESEAKRLCARCPVARECLDTAQRDGSVDGVYGGTTGAERAQVRGCLSAGVDPAVVNAIWRGENRTTRPTPAEMAELFARMSRVGMTRDEARAQWGIGRGTLYRWQQEARLWEATNARRG